MGIFGLRGIVNHYNNNGSKVFGCFLDASKAFDNVMHEKLCLKLSDRKIPISVVRLFYRWCKTQPFCILWANDYSRDFCVHKSVRQGGVLSPYLFSLYMDELGFLLSQSGVGCRIGSTSCNNLWYADDLCLLAPSVTALQRLIDICCDYVTKHNIAFNSRKTVCMVLDFSI